MGHLPGQTVRQLSQQRRVIFTFKQTLEMLVIPDGPPAAPLRDFRKLVVHNSDQHNPCPWNVM